jgi:hypothetical protein
VNQTYSTAHIKGKMSNLTIMKINMSRLNRTVFSDTLYLVFSFILQVSVLFTRRFHCNDGLHKRAI